VWTREDDFTNDFYRPASTALMKWSVNGEGEINYWYHRIVSDSVLTYAIYDFLGAIIPSGWTDGKVNFFGMKLSGAFKFNRALLSDTSSFEGAEKAPYYCKNKLVEYQYQNCGVPLGFWRSVGHSQTIFMVESFMDELAHSANINPYNFRIDTIKKAFKTMPIIEIGNNQREELERSLRVIEKVGAMSGISSSGRNGRYQGIAQSRSFGSYCAQVVKIQMVDGKPKIEKVYCAIDCGQIVNPDIIKAQMEGSIIFGLTAALKQEITIKDGVVEQTNFNNSDLLRMYETPEIVVEIIESDYKAGGVGEPGVPPVAPALCNAIYLATNKRIRSLPIKEI
jgi:isoquinoline 1-oxidoreductase beta subunit